MGYLGQFSNPGRVRELLEEEGAKQGRDRQRELKRVERRLKRLESDLLKNVGLLKREAINEEEFRKVNEMTRAGTEEMKKRKKELSAWMEKAEARAKQAGELPGVIRSFLEDFQELDIHRQKAHLQRILQRVQIWKDGRVELEMRM